MTKKSEKTVIAPGVEVSRSDIAEAKTEGAIEAFKDSGRAAVAADTGTAGDTDAMQEAARLAVPADLQSTVLAPLLDLPLETLSKRMTNEKLGDFIPFEDVKGLLHLERCGRNRTDWVKMMCDRLGVKSPLEVSSAGPGYTNDVHPVSEL